MTSAAVNALLRRGIDTIFLTHKGDYRGRLLSHKSKNAKLRIEQYRFFSDPENKLRLARQFLDGKLANQRAVLVRFQNSRPHSPYYLRYICYVCQLHVLFVIFRFSLLEIG